MKENKVNNYLSDAFDSLLCARIELKGDPARWVVITDLMNKIRGVKELGGGK